MLPKWAWQALNILIFSTTLPPPTLTIAATGTNVTTRQDSLDAERIAHKNFRQNGNEWRYLASLVVNKKFSASDRLTAGITADQLHYSYSDSIRNADYGFIPFAVEKNHTRLLRGFAQWQHRFGPRLTLNSGVYSQYLALNSNTSVEGRLGLRYTLPAAGALTLAYGKHSQMQSLMSYFHETRVGDEYICKPIATWILPKAIIWWQAGKKL
ncbi:hypothetical protein LWM68_00340 [Niabella sp. W65]|nr:hypothetical protein [Niabella sp. W65]MCH7361369.1 hypothetical protein [Niabella sp. W65]